MGRKQLIELLLSGHTASLHLSNENPKYKVSAQVTHVFAASKKVFAILKFVFSLDFQPQHCGPEDGALQRSCAAPVSLRIAPRLRNKLPSARVQQLSNVQNSTWYEAYDVGRPQAKAGVKPQTALVIVLLRAFIIDITDRAWLGLLVNVVFTLGRRLLFGMIRTMVSSPFKNTRSLCHMVNIVRMAPLFFIGSRLQTDKDVSGNESTIGSCYSPMNIRDVNGAGRDDQDPYRSRPQNANMSILHSQVFGRAGPQSSSIRGPVSWQQVMASISQGVMAPGLNFTINPWSPMTASITNILEGFQIGFPPMSISETTDIGYSTYSIKDDNGGIFQVIEKFKEFEKLPSLGKRDTKEMKESDWNRRRYLSVDVYCGYYQFTLKLAEISVGGVILLKSISNNYPKFSRNQSGQLTTKIDKVQETGQVQQRKHPFLAYGIVKWISRCREVEIYIEHLDNVSEKSPLNLTEPQLPDNATYSNWEENIDPLIDFSFLDNVPESEFNLDEDNVPEPSEPNNNSDDSDSDSDVFCDTDYDLDEDDREFDMSVDPNVELDGFLGLGKGMAEEMSCWMEGGGEDLEEYSDEFVSSDGSDEDNLKKFPKFNPIMKLKILI
ncbi:hypothetical protein DH2020_014431 [Rehmannia glutinosa]|uniref:Uncharacterized protein n=1 Tax=Rehmannia glutinosa TaxID=99300 RepID=A0ABR0WXS2_REHGL